jgi:hypothetical protein
MAKPSNWKKIERQVENLSLRDKQKLLAKLVKGLRQRDRRKGTRDWTKLYGLGKGLWNGEDAQDYVNRSREDRM